MKSIARIPLALCAGVALAMAAPSAVCATASAQEVAAVSPAAASNQASDYASVILAKVNELRSSLGLAPVTRYVQLDAISQQWSEHMANTGQFAHRNLSGGGFPKGYRKLSENIAYRSGAPGEDVGAELFEQWRHSPGHYQNMVDPEVNSIGIGVAYQASNGQWYGTQNFAYYADPAGAGLTPTGSPSVPAPDKPSPAPSAAPKPDPKSTTEPTAAPKPEGTPGVTPAPQPSSEASAEPAPHASAAPSAKPSATPTPKAKAGAGGAKQVPVPVATPDRQVIALPTRGSTGGATASQTPEVVVAAPERSKSAPSADSLPMTGVSLGVAMVALGLTGAGVVAFTVRVRRRA
ncbi:uncharacterized protein, YkwD family [Actinomyces bovis]|uniref:Uncharacterized protein, YkwD family n=1 Tax=Actinomyces bovis TaxID=1658 RepID=A0ABY1VMZ3_9ACTO|nr:CAP domain-containing protein [Actinomyces bovis]SPT53198.1 uncharacterized protein, YkwD family [Actinomyces bovis]VEG52418.1 uncharacterized protein, YkwD family [Actinomyces israelii]